MVEMEVFPSFPQQYRPPTIIVENIVGIINSVEKECVTTNVEEECVTTKCGKRMCENVWECVRICASKCGCAKSVILDDVPMCGTSPNVEMTSSPRLFIKLHCSCIPHAVLKSSTFKNKLVHYKSEKS